VAAQRRLATYFVEELGFEVEWVRLFMDGDVNSPFLFSTSIQMMDCVG